MTQVTACTKGCQSFPKGHTNSPQDEESKRKIESEYGLYAEGDGIYLYKKGYQGESILLD